MSLLYLSLFLIHFTCSFDISLLGFISDYLLKRGLTKTVDTLYNENISPLIPKPDLPKLVDSVNEIRNIPGPRDEESESVLFEWWRVFWNILRNSKRKFGNPNEPGPDHINIQPAQSTHYECLDPSSNPFKRLRKKPLKCIDTLDISSLTGIERSLTSVGLMNKDLNKLTVEEGERVEIALKGNNVSKESWEMYLKLCKEYQRPRGSKPLIPGNNTIMKNNTNIPTKSMPTSAPVSTSTSVPASASSYNPVFPSLKVPSNYLGVIDQVNQPIDSRQLLILRQTLFQEYLKRQQRGEGGAIENDCCDKDATDKVTIDRGSHERNTSEMKISTRSHTQNHTHIDPHGQNYMHSYNTDNHHHFNTHNTQKNTLQNNPINLNNNITPPESLSYHFFEESNELNFDDFMNDYLI